MSTDRHIGDIRIGDTVVIGDNYLANPETVGTPYPGAIGRVTGYFSLYVRVVFDTPTSRDWLIRPDEIAFKTGDVVTGYDSVGVIREIRHIKSNGVLVRWADGDLAGLTLGASLSQLTLANEEPLLVETRVKVDGELGVIAEPRDNDREYYVVFDSGDAEYVHEYDIEVVPVDDVDVKLNFPYVFFVDDDNPSHVSVDAVRRVLTEALDFDDETADVFIFAAIAASKDAS